VKLLFLTQVLDADDAVLGFVPRWIEGLARQCERVRVVALEVGNVSALPANVDWRAIGRKGQLRRYLRYRAVLREALRGDGYDTVLAHMVPRYATLAAGPSKSAGARVFLWYTHGTADERLRRAEAAVEKIFTASPESLRLETQKRVVTGHGIDLEHFDTHGRAPASPPRILAVGRLTPAKDPLTVIEALRLLRQRGVDAHLDLAGAGLTESDAGYAAQVRASLAGPELAARVTLHGAVPYREIPRLCERATLCVNASLTGSVDKVVLEGFAARRPVLSCNEAFPGLIAELGAEARALCFAKGSAEELAARLETWLAKPPAERAALGERLRAIVARDHEVDALMRRLCAEMAAR
jgi:glycosyltransferase involved in cell wall biosynthesis